MLAGAGRESRFRGCATVLALLAAVLASGVWRAPNAQAQTPPDFYGITPQAGIYPADTAEMENAGVRSIRVSVSWAYTQPLPTEFVWGALDSTVRLAAKSGIEVLPVLYRTPQWAAQSQATLPVDTLVQRLAWQRFLQAAVSRYGPGGSFWAEHGPSSADPIAPLPIRNWQIWNEPNFFYFATPASPQRYATLVKISSQAIRAVDPGAKVILGGLFGFMRPTEYPREMGAVEFLEALYGTPGITDSFDGVAIHPWVSDARLLPEVLRPLREVVLRHGDGGTTLWITEVGWGSQGAGGSAHEKGLAGQADELREAYTYMTSSAREWLNLTHTYWYTWQDAPPPACYFCDSTGLFWAGQPPSPKPAWAAFKAFSTAPPGDLAGRTDTDGDGALDPLDLCPRVSGQASHGGCPLVDTISPWTMISKLTLRHGKRRASLRFSSNERASTFRCKLDRRPYRRCSSPKTYRRLRPGRHAVRIVARDTAGNRDRTPAVKKFRIRRRAR